MTEEGSNMDGTNEQFAQIVGGITPAPHVSDRAERIQEAQVRTIEAQVAHIEASARRVLAIGALVSVVTFGLLLSMIIGLVWLVARVA